MKLLRGTFDDLRFRTVLDFDAGALVEFERLKSAKIRIGTNDLRIAAIVLAYDALLLTRNLADFCRVPRLRAEDWSA
jgi:tRNA(fMet)-specific endonuclease VapC